MRGARLGPMPLELSPSTTPNLIGITTANRILGQNAFGRVNILGGGRLESDEAVLGENEGGRGLVVIDFAGQWDNDGDLVVGQLGSGTVSINSAGTLNSGNAWIAMESGSGGDVMVGSSSENPSVWNVTGGDLVIGGTDSSLGGRCDIEH